MRELLTVIGLVIQLAASFLLAVRGFTDKSLKRVFLSASTWKIALLPGLVSTILLCACAFSTFLSRERSAVLFALSLICAASWLPALAKYSVRFLDHLDDPRNDIEIETLNRNAILLLAVGFIVAALSALM
jgi:hypothetical protein